MYLACSACKLQYDVSSYNEGTRVRCKCGEVLTVPSQQVKSICCATCGASVPTNSTQCPYCKGAVRRAVCPSCFRGLREDAKFCDSCGEAIRPQLIKPPEATDRDCPRCEGSLFHVQMEGYAVDQCGGCAGLWIDAPTVEAIMRDSPKAVETGIAPDLATGSSDQAAILTGEFKGRAYVPCPHCSKIMTPQNYARYSGIIVDVCKDHGIWFDAGELNRILEFVARGGLVKARVKEAERAKDDARAARIDAQTASIQSRATAHTATGYPMQSTPGQGLFLEAVVEGLFGLFKK
ncbi:MAG: zf-TFIIB domain-containing protein [Myxococcota bacterium]|nr:zf-TFIIB domain-containing protein [Myxococcota bacterium]